MPDDDDGAPAPVTPKNVAAAFEAFPEWRPHVRVFI